MKKKAIIINYTGRKGGGSIVSYEMAKALLDEGETVIPIISKQVENVKMWEQLDFEKMIALDTYTNKINFLINTIRFRGKNRKRILDQTKAYEIKAVYGPMMTYWTGNINNLFPKAKKIVGLHDPIPHSGESVVSRIMLAILYKKILGSADEIIVHSKKFVGYVRKKYGKAFYLPLGPHNLCGISQKTEVSPEERADVINYLFFGRIEAYKGLDVLAEAYESLKKRYERITLTVVGSGDFSGYKDKYSQLADVKIINRWVKNEEVESIFSGGNIVNVCPYKDATQSGVVLTSYGFGVPVIVTDTGGLEEQVVEGKTGFVVESNNAVALEKAMEMFVLDKNMISNMQQGIKEYLNDVSWEKSAKKLLGLIEEKA